MRPGLPAWRRLASQNEKYAYRYQNMTSHHGLTKRVAAPIATSEYEIRYGLFKLTKRSDKLFKCFHRSRSLRTIFCLSFDLPSLFTILGSKAEFFVPSTLVAAMFRNSGILDSSKCRMTLFIRRNLPQGITVMIINTGQMCIVNYPGRPRMRDLKCPDWEKTDWEKICPRSSLPKKKKNGKHTAYQEITFLFHTVINNE